MSLDTEADVGEKRLQIMAGYCDYLYGLMPASEIQVIETYKRNHNFDSIDVSKIIANLQLNTVDDLISLPSIPSAAARKIVAGLSRLNQIEGVDTYNTLFDLLGTSPTDTVKVHDEARSAAVTANSRRRFNDPRKSIIGELLSYCRTFLTTNNNEEYITYAAKNTLEPLCAGLVATGIYGSALRKELLSAARRCGLSTASGAVLALHLIKAETGGLSTAIDMGFSVCANCHAEKLSAMPCTCSGKKADPKVEAEKSGAVEWSHLVDTGASALRQFTLKMTTPLRLPTFRYSRLRQGTTGAVQLLLEAQNPNRIFELHPGNRYEHPAAQWNIAVQLEPDSSNIFFTGDLPSFMLSIQNAQHNIWHEIQGMDGFILPIRLMVSTTRRLPQTSNNNGLDKNSFLQRFMESLSGAAYVYGRWLQ